MTAITAEWLESVGFEQWVSDSCVMALPLGDQFLIYNRSTGKFRLRTEAGDIVLFPNVHTRDDVRALVRMLGGEWPDESSESN